jgi:Mrp family chromosome partitioning ATPase
MGFNVVFFYVDICGPSQARLFNCEDESVTDGESGWEPIIVRDNVVLMSIAFLLEDRSSAVVWRGKYTRSLAFFVL